MKSLLATIVLVLLAFPFDIADGACPANWNYGDKGPDRWGQMEDGWAACDGGHRQSPVNLGGATRGASPPSLTIAYGPSPLVVQNTGHDIRVPLGNGTVTFGRVGSLQQFHFHAPAEHWIGNERPAAELHFVNPISATEAIALGVLIDEDSADNPALEAILQQRPPTECTSRKLLQPNFNPMALLPANKTEFYYYSGSLTTPNCVEGVTWVVLRQHIKASRRQIDLLKVDGHENARPLQPLGTRTVAKNFS